MPSKSIRSNLVQSACSALLSADEGVNRDKHDESDLSDTMMGVWEME